MRYNGLRVISVKLIKRTNYLNKFVSVINTPDIKVITGVENVEEAVL